MGLIKKIKLESGADVEYHNVSLLKNTPAGSLTAYVNSYVSEEARRDGKPPVVADKPYRIPQEIWQGKGDGIEVAAFNWLKTLPEFEEAKDCV